MAVEQPICVVDDCECPVHVKKRGLCALHYERWKRYGDPTAPVKELHRRPGDPMPTCTVEGCDEDAPAKGLCRRHYANRRRTGNPIPLHERPPMQRLESVGWDVTESGCWEWRGSRNRGGYGTLTVDGKKWPAHRLMLTLHMPPQSDELVTRHHCDNPPCVNPDHLAWGTQADNAQDMVDRSRQQAYHADYWGGMCRNGLHDITLAGAVIYTESKTRCRECTEGARREYKKRRRAQAD